MNKCYCMAARWITHISTRRVLINLAAEYISTFISLIHLATMYYKPYSPGRRVKPRPYFKVLKEPSSYCGLLS